MSAGSYITPATAARLKARMAELGIDEADLGEKFVLGSGRGGQKVNKTNSCVYLKHEPSGIEVKCQRSRSRSLNRHWARVALCEKMAEKKEGVRSARQQRREKIRRQKRRKSRRQRERELKAKKHRGEKKRLRRSVSPE